jgi:hypothetical protein
MGEGRLRVTADVELYVRDHPHLNPPPSKGRKLKDEDERGNST